MKDLEEIKYLITRVISWHKNCSIYDNKKTKILALS